MRDDFPLQLEKRKAEATLQVFMKAARLLNEHALTIWNATQPEHLQIRASHTALMPHLDLEGTRLTTLAERLGVSKQAVGQLVSELEEMGVIKREPDPTDGRAKLVCFTERGLTGLFDGLELLQDLEQELVERVGKRRMKEFAETLTTILQLIGDTDSNCA